jgi:hypothetical protein
MAAEKEKSIFDDIEIEDGDGFHSYSDDKYHIKRIVMEQLNHCIKEGSKEMDSGGIRKRIINGQEVEVSVPNQREIFCNGVDMLWILIAPQIGQHKKLVDMHIAGFDDEIKDAKEEYNKMNAKANSIFIYNKQRDATKLNEHMAQRNNMLRENSEWFGARKTEIYHKKLNAINFLLAKIEYFGERGV